MIQKPRIFVSHCENNFEPTAYACRIINLLGCQPVIAETQPKHGKNVPNLVHGAMNSCDAVIVIATPDSKEGKTWSPSRGVMTEIGQLTKSKKFKGKFTIIKETSVKLGAMIDTVYTTFEKNNYGPIAEGIMVELYSMGFYKNYFELPGNEMKMHEFMEALYELKKVGQRGTINQRHYKDAVKKLIEGTVAKVMNCK